MTCRFSLGTFSWSLPSRLVADQQHLSIGAASSPSPSPSDTPLLNVSGPTALVFVGAVALAVATLWFIPTLYDLRRTDKWRSTKQSELLSKMVDAASVKGLSVEDVRQIASAMNTPPRGLQGLTQALLGLVITTMVGVAMVATLVSTAADSSDLRKTIITALLSILATIAGFYFGARTAQISSEQATRPPVASTGDTTGPGTAPAVTEVNPNSGPTRGGKFVRLTGSGFTGATTVNFGTVAASNLTVISDTQLTVTSPAGAKGTVDVTVTSPAGTSTTTSADHYSYADPEGEPVVTDVNPKNGPVGGGQLVTVIGQRFTGATGVNFGIKPATNLTVVSDTQLTVTSPSQDSGSVQVVVTTPIGSSAVPVPSADAEYTYDA